MPSIDMSNIGVPVYMTFYYANAQNTSTSNDDLSVWATNNCGEIHPTVGQVMAPVFQQQELYLSVLPLPT